MKFNGLKKKYRDKFIIKKEDMNNRPMYGRWG